MKETVLETRRVVESTVDVKRIDELEKWFAREYVSRLNTINRYTYLGLPLPETRYALEMEAYHKENELRALKGQEPLPESKLKKIF